MADDPVLIITGASSGIGAATARAAAESGYRLVLGARREDALAELADELGGSDRALAVRCDVTEWADNERLATEAIDAFGGFDAVFANAGFGAKRGFEEESLPDHELGRRPAGAAGFAVLGHQVGGHRDRGGAAR